MVKQYLFLSFLFIVLFHSCKKNELIRVDSMLVYQNYLETVTINFDSLEKKSIIKEQLLSSNEFANSGELIEIKGEIKEAFVNEYYKMDDNYRRINDGYDYTKFTPKKDAEHLYYCGKLNLHKNVESLLFLYTYDPGIMTESIMLSPVNKLILYNFEGKEIRSVVVLSDEFAKKLVNFNSKLLTIIINNYFTTYLYEYPVYNDGQRIFYTSFNVDEKGFIRFEVLDEKEILEVFESILSRTDL